MNSKFKKIILFFGMFLISILITLLISSSKINNIKNLKSDINKESIYEEEMNELINENNKLIEKINEIKSLIYNIEHYDLNKEILLNNIEKNKDDLESLKDEINKINKKIKEQKNYNIDIKKYIVTE